MELSEQVKASYDSVLYRGYSFVETHPDRTAALAMLFGVEPPSVDNCSVLELGCGCGENLIPMALTLPQSRFVGIDFSEKQIEEAKRTIDLLGLSNISCQCADIVEFDLNQGRFDYIICHGVFTWVTEEVQEKILAICSAALSDQGLAYISCNTMPGWHEALIARDIMRYHQSSMSAADQQISRSLGFLEFVSRATEKQNASYHQLLARQFGRIKDKPEWYVAHEHLDTINTPAYFSDINKRAEAYGLQYVGDARLHTMFPQKISPEAQKELNNLAEDRIAREQLIDFVINRVFRRNLFCLSGVSVSEEPCPEQLDKLFLASPLRPADSVSRIRAGEKLTFHNPRGPSLITDDHLLVAAYLALGDAWPRWISFEELLRNAGDRLRRDDSGITPISEKEVEHLRHRLLLGLKQGTVELHTASCRIAVQVEAEPRTSPFARIQSEHSTLVTNLRHEPVNLAGAHARLLRYFDGTRDQTALHQVILELIQQGTLSLQISDQAQAGHAQQSQAAAQILTQTLEKFRQEALLMT